MSEKYERRMLAAELRLNIISIAWGLGADDLVAIAIAGSSEDLTRVMAQIPTRAAAGGLSAIRKKLLYGAKSNPTTAPESVPVQPDA